MVRWERRAGRQALVRVVGRGSRGQVVVFNAAMTSMFGVESAGEKAVRGGLAGERSRSG